MEMYDWLVALPNMREELSSVAVVNGVLFVMTSGITQMPWLSVLNLDSLESVKESNSDDP